MVYSFATNKYVHAGIIFFIVLLFSFYSPRGDFTTTPKFWRDEAIPFELARTYYELGKMDVVVSPGQVDGRPYLTHATGYQLLIPMAGVFSVFGVGVVQARIFMIFWIIAAVVALFFVLKSFFGLEGASWGAILIASFAPFYANGRTFTGEIPGFLFLILALYYLVRRKNYVAAGIFLGLAAVTKPSVYLLLIPATFFYMLLADRENLFVKALKIILGASPFFIFWVYIIVPNPFSISDWASMIDLYRHPFDAPSILAHFGDGLRYIITHSTIIYFTLITIVTYTAFRRGGYSVDGRKLFLFTIVYGVFSFIYFLRSPGWFRYLLVFQLLILGLLFPAIDYFGKRFKFSPIVAVLALVVLQSVNYLFFSDIQSGAKSIETARFINNKLLAGNDATVGFIYMPTVAALIEPSRKFQIGTIGGKEVYGTHPLSLPPEKLPTYIIGFDGIYKEALGAFYEPLIEAPNGHMLYKKR